MLFTRQRIRTPLAVGGEVAVFQLVAGETLVAPGVVLFKNGKGKVREAVMCTTLEVNPVAALTELL